MKFNFRKITAVLASGLMAVSGVAFAAAASFPAPFSDGSTSGTAIVYGADSADFAPTSSINSYLADHVDSEAGEPTGEFTTLERSSDKVNIGDTISTVAGTSVNDDDLPTLLADGEYSNDENTEYAYEQKITLGSWALTHFADSDYEEKEPTVGVKIADNTFVLNYTLDFTTDPESDVDSSDLVDFETTTINLFGTEYYVSNFDNGTTWKMELLDTANTGIVQEGETVTVTVDGTTYEVSIHSLTTTEARLIVNGDVTNELSEGVSYHLGNDIYLGVKDIYQRDVSGVTGSVEFSIGSGKLEIESTVTGSGASEVQLNDENVQGLVGYLHRGTATGNRERLDKIVLEWTVDDDQFITPTSELVIPGFENIKLSMGDLVIDEEEEITVDYSSEVIEVDFPFKDGTGKFSLLYANDSGELSGIGAAADEVLRTTSGPSMIFNRTTDEWFIASYVSTSDAESYLLRAQSFTNNTDGSAQVDFYNHVTGATVCSDRKAGQDCEIGEVIFDINAVHDDGSDEWVNISVGSGVTFNESYTAGGLKMVLPVTVAVNTTGMGAINFSDSHKDTAANVNTGGTWDKFLLWFDEENKDDTIAGGTAFNITIDDLTSDKKDLEVSSVDAGALGGGNLEVLGTDDDTVAYVASELGTKVELEVGASDKGKAVITYHGEQMYAPIYLTGSTSATTASGSMIFKDSETGWKSRNVVLVGGSCANDATAELLGGSYCEAAFTDATEVDTGRFMIETFDSPWADGKVAVVVAGYSAADTNAAAQALINPDNDFDTAVGTKYFGTVGATEGETVIDMA